MMKGKEELGSGGTDEPVTGKEELGPGRTDEATGKEELRILNEKMNVLMDRRKAELGQGILDSDTRRQLSGFKPIVDQFNFIAKVTSDIEKLSQVLVPEKLDGPVAASPAGPLEAKKAL